MTETRAGGPGTPAERLDRAIALLFGGPDPVFEAPIDREGIAAGGPSRGSSTSPFRTR